MKRLIQTQIELDSQKLETVTDVKFQNIIYYYWDGKKTVTQNQQVQIDFLGAVSEMEKLDHTFEKNRTCPRRNWQHFRRTKKSGENNRTVGPKFQEK